MEVVDKVEEVIEEIRIFKKRYPDAEINFEYRKKLHPENGKMIQDGVVVTVEFNHEPHEV